MAMFEDAALALEIWRLNLARKRVSTTYDLLARKAPSEADEAPIVFERQMRFAEIEDAVQQLKNNRLIREARGYSLVLPPLDEKHEDWEESEFTQQWRLTPKTFIELRNAVRAERKARHEIWQSRIVGISAATGLIGALTGIISVTFFHTLK
jgi:hypothetical protein